MIEQRLIVVNQSFHSAKKTFTADHGHSRRQFAVPIKRSCARIETKKGTLDFTKMQDEDGSYMEDFHRKLANILRRVGLPYMFRKVSETVRDACSRSRAFSKRFCTRYKTAH